MNEKLHARARRVRERSLIRAWEYRQRTSSNGVWHRFRRILVDAARARGSGKRGGGAVRLDINESIDALPQPDSRLVDLDDALESLARFDARKAKVVELRFFGGLSVGETAEVLKISPESVMRDWKLARAWLMHELSR